eukprot:CAMPEP_0181327258 /NCGR_PEP_ID=MMETSP1101-20121128/21992_1 /TAXON_ID=46948 /ORGANISM="Rhodomonas abbreviata, Strain Caron Lab Isolate" /LENGTH=52 /DNA_ID=CAMNT_0023435879 /DNA_START=34 /DNA_END=189 /DNA_ORIENTATION=+
MPLVKQYTIGQLMAPGTGPAFAAKGWGGEMCASCCLPVECKHLLCLACVRTV